MARTLQNVLEVSNSHWLDESFTIEHIVGFYLIYLLTPILDHTPNFVPNLSFSFIKNFCSKFDP